MAFQNQICEYACIPVCVQISSALTIGARISAVTYIGISYPVASFVVELFILGINAVHKTLNTIT